MNNTHEPEYLIELNDLHKTFGNIKAVDGISLNVPKGKIFGILGPNGAGKSTLIRMLCGVLRPTAGSGTVFGYDIVKDSETIKLNIGYMSQKFSLYEDLTVYENLKFYTEIYAVKKKFVEERIDQIISMAGLKGRKNQITGTLSGGWKQRLALGCTLIHKPKLLILDEPTAGVDPVSRRVFWEIIYRLSRQGISVLVTTHYMDEAASCDEVAFVFNGKVIGQGTPKDIIAEKNVDTLEDVFIHYEEAITGQKVMSSYDELKFLLQSEEALEAKEREGD